MKFWMYYYLVVLDLPIFVLLTGLPKILDKRIMKYEPVYYNKQSVLEQHMKAGRLDNTPVNLQFTAYNREFNLVLRRHNSSSTSKFSLKVGGKSSTTTDTSFIYFGKDTAYSESHVYGKIEDGVFEGTIHLTDTQVYHVQSSHTLFVDNVDFPSIIYSHHDFHLPSINTDFYETQTSNMYQGTNFQNNRRRFKRSGPTPAFSDTKPKSFKTKFCSLKLTADNTVWKFVMNHSNQNEVRTESDIIYRLVSHVEELNRIYQRFDFPVTRKNGKGQQSHLRLQFFIKNIEILKDGGCNNTMDKDSFPGSEVFYTTRDPTTLLHEYAITQDDYPTYEGDYDDYDSNSNNDFEIYETPNHGEKDTYCLIFLFTARDLRQKRGKTAFPVLGAVLPFGKENGHGICRTGGNFGFVTFCQFGETTFLPSTVTSLVFAHEVAHAMGALHDDDTDTCHSSHPDGYYLMYSRAQTGKDPNNRKLSNCSMQPMSNTLSDPDYTNCFIEHIEPVCGNSIVEKDEECDSGIDCEDTCCYGPNHNDTSKQCKLKPGAQCSPSNGPCCHADTCQFVMSQQKMVCQSEKACVDKIYCECNGWNYKASCPPAFPAQIRPDGFHCSQYGRVCDAGSCNKSICDLINWHECQVTNSNQRLTIEDKEELCFLGCQKTKNSPCVTSHNQTKMQEYLEFGNLLHNMSTLNTPLHFPIGWPCNSNTGYCDPYHRCRGTEPETPLVFLKNCLLSGDCLEFVMSHPWKSVVFICCVFVIVPVLIAKFCAIHTKSSNPILERKHPKQTLRQSWNRLSSINIENIRHPLHNVRNSFNFENFRHSFHGKSTRPTEINIENLEFSSLNVIEETDDGQTKNVKETVTSETEVLNKESH